MPPTTNSDSEDDPDYVPPVDDHDSDTSDQHDVVENIAEGDDVDPAEQKRRRDALWASFQASVSAPSEPPSQPPAKRVQIEKTYLFAGKHVTEVVEMPEDAAEATVWPRRSPRSGLESERGSIRPSGEEEGTPDVDPSRVAMAKPAGMRPGPRKPRAALPSIPKASQAKKITTLDKSAMDWRAHVNSQSSDVRNELDANRRGGGYLEKVEFLKRVEGRRDEAFEASKSSKRRKT